MLLWDIIRDWFVINIWGGMASNGDYFSGSIGMLDFVNENGDIDSGAIDTSMPFVKIGEGYFPDILGGNNAGSSGSAYLSLGDWLSTTSTIIVLVILCIVFGLMVRWLFRLTSGLLQGR